MVYQGTNQFKYTGMNVCNSIRHHMFSSAMADMQHLNRVNEIRKSDTGNNYFLSNIFVISKQKFVRKVQRGHGNESYEIIYL